MKTTKRSSALLRKRMPSVSRPRAAPQRKPVPQTRATEDRRLLLAKSEANPILAPREDRAWESRQTFNPAAIYEDGRVHLLYRALGDDGISVVGYAASRDGIVIEERSNDPVFVPDLRPSALATTRPAYGSCSYTSGGGYGGCEDPRATCIDERVYLTYVAFDGWSPPRVALTSLSLQDFLAKRWNWAGTKIISPPGVVDKSGCLFPEKINGKYVMMHRIFPDILIDFLDDLEFKDGAHLKGEHRIRPRPNRWDSRKIGAGAPPIKTSAGWLLIYYAVDEKDSSRYKIGAMLLDLKNPTRVRYRTDEPILEPAAWYENEGHKQGVAYPCGAVVVNGRLHVYYGGADTVVCVATADLEEFLAALMRRETPKLKRVRRKR